MSDVIKAAYNGWGREISDNYVDPHENHLYADIKLAVDSGQSVRVLDLACGLGATSVRLADAGAIVTAVDLNPDTQTVLRQASQGTSIRFLCADIRNIKKITSDKFDYILFQRALDCMNGHDGTQMLHDIKDMLKPGGKLYLTVSSPDADYADGYKGKDVPLDQRFHKLAPIFRKAHHFHQPICMWKKEELAGLLIQYDCTISAHYLSHNGSNKVIAIKRTKHT